MLRSPHVALMTLGTLGTLTAAVLVLPALPASAVAATTTVSDTGGVLTATAGGGGVTLLVADASGGTDGSTAGVSVRARDVRGDVAPVAATGCADPVGDGATWFCPAVQRVAYTGSAGDDRVDATGLSWPLQAALGGGDDTGVGGSGADVLDGGPGDDDLDGRAGADRLVPGAGTDAVRGGPGTDTVDYADVDTDAAFVVTLDGAADSGVAGEHDAVAVDVEDVTGPAHHAGSVSITGSDRDNVLTTSGTTTDGERMRGLGGDDQLTATGVGAGTTRLRGDDGDDVLSSDGTATVGGDAGDDVITTGAGDDVLAGGPGVDVLSSGDGDDDVTSFDAADESVDCGPGTDHASVDVGDTLTGCEDAVRPLPTALVPALAPVRVPADGTLNVPVRNDSIFGVQVTTDVTVGTLAHAGSGRTAVTDHARGQALLTLTPAGLARLEARSWLTAQVHVQVAGNGGQVAFTRSVRLVAPSVTTRAAANPTNPLAGLPWATYEGRQEPAWDPYVKAKGAVKDQLATIALTPKARWFVSQVPPAQLRTIVHDYVQTSLAETPGGLVQLTMFVLDPWETEATQRLPTPAEIRLDKAYIKAFVDGIGSAHAMVVVQPDGPFAGEEPHHSKILAHLVGSAVHQLSALPHTAAYIDMGSADWHRGDTSKEIPLLLAENVAEARGFAMDVTHADSTAHQITHAHRLVTRLAAHGVRGKHAVIDTSDNGRPFGGQEWQASPHAGTPISAAPACRTAAQRLCLVLGIPPTTDVANPRWGLTAAQRRLAAQEVDAYVWVKRPWCDPHKKGYPFDTRFGLDVVRYSPYR